jgi:hypothetical protein
LQTSYILPEVSTSNTFPLRVTTTAYQPFMGLCKGTSLLGSDPSTEAVAL